MGAVQPNLADCFVVPKSDFFSIFFYFGFQKVLYHAVFIMRIDACMFEKYILSVPLFTLKNTCFLLVLCLCVFLCVCVKDYLISSQ